MGILVVVFLFAWLSFGCCLLYRVCSIYAFRIKRNRFVELVAVICWLKIKSPH